MMKHTLLNLANYKKVKGNETITMLNGYKICPITLE